LPPAGKTSPQDTTQDTTQDTAAAPPDLLSIAGLPPLPVQPQATLEAATALAPARTDSTAAEQTLAGATVETLSHAAGDARAQRATPRTLLAMLEQHLGKTGPGEQLPDALRALVATTDGAAATKLAAAASVNAATAEATAGDGSPATATLTHPGADNAALPSGAATPAAALLAPADPAHAQLRTLEIEQPVGQPGWQDAVGQHVTWMVEQQVGRAELRLHPAHLGPIEVSVSVHNDEVNVSFHALHADTRDALQSSLPRLRELLGDSGLSLGQATVSQQFAGDQRSPERAPAATSVGALQFDDTGLTQEVVAAPRAIRGLLDAYA
jgi:flagellar hook-length control protein FliK